MNILVISNAAWDDKNSSGNTYSNLFNEWEGATFHSMYSREQLPNNSCCSTYYCISPFNLIKNIFTPWKIGKSFSKQDIPYQVTLSQSENRAKNEINGFTKNLILLFIDILYLTGIWMNDKAKNYIKQCNPDIVVMTGISEAYRYKIAQYIKKYTNAKLVTYIVDDTYHTEKESGTLLGKLRARRYKKIFNMSDKIYGITKEMCEAYKNKFGYNISLLTKGCELSTPKTFINNPIQFVYAGNLLYGRDEILAELAKSLSKFNRDETKAFLNIYTGTVIHTSMANKLNIDGTSAIQAPKPYDEIKKIMKNADIVLHVESFEPEQIKLVRYSFSTKITDCLQSGAVMMAIGPSGISSIEYSKIIPGSIVITNLTELDNVISTIISEPNSLINKSKLSNDFAKINFDISTIRKKLQDDFNNLIHEKNSNS